MIHKTKNKAKSRSRYCTETTIKHDKNKTKSWLTKKIGQCCFETFYKDALPANLLIKKDSPNASPRRASKSRSFSSCSGVLVLGSGVLVLVTGVLVLGTGNPPGGGGEARGFFTAVAEDWIRVDSRLGQPTVSSLKVSRSCRCGRFLRLNVSCCCRGGGRLPKKRKVKSVFWIRIGFNADPDPAIYLTADPDPDPGSYKQCVSMRIRILVKL